MITALYLRRPAEFVGLFGKAAFLEVLGPGVERVVPRSITREEISPRGQAALAEFQRLLGEQPGPTFEGAIGTFTD